MKSLRASRREKPGRPLNALAYFATEKLRKLCGRINGVTRRSETGEGVELSRKPKGVPFQREEQLGYLRSNVHALICRSKAPGALANVQTTIKTKMAAAALAKRVIPLLDRVLIQRAEAITKTKGGIVLPEKAQGKVHRGTVVAIGPGSRNEQGEHVPLSIKVGDTVLLPEYGGTKVELEENKEFHLFRESDILAKLES